MKSPIQVTPSFLLHLMKVSSRLRSEKEIILAFDQLRQNSSEVLTSEDANALDQAVDDTPEHLIDLRQALEGAIEDEDD